MRPFFITGIGTGVGKTLAAAILTEALQADYWKPIQAGYEEGTDTGTVKELVSNPHTIIHPEVYRLQKPASPHIAAREEQVDISIDRIVLEAKKMNAERPLIIEGAGGLLVPISGNLFVADLIRALDARVLIVSRNYLGSINHSLLTAAYCKTHGIDVAGWIFNDDYLQYEDEIVNWSGYPVWASIPRLDMVNAESTSLQANRISTSLTGKLQAL